MISYENRTNSNGFLETIQYYINYTERYQVVSPFNLIHRLDFYQIISIIESHEVAIVTHINEKCNYRLFLIKRTVCGEKNPFNRE